MIIVGLNAFHADAAAAIFVNGELIAASEEERFVRIKHRAGFPAEAVKFCLAEAGVSFKDADVFAIGRKPGAKIPNRIAYLLQNPVAGYHAVRARLQNRQEILSLKPQLGLASGLLPERFNEKIRYVEHHRSHLASAFFASGFEEAAVVSIDGSGDFTTTMSAIGKGNKLTIDGSIDFPHSLGIFYTAFTQLLGFPYYGDEYKVMGMAPYGSPKYTEALMKVVRLKRGGRFALDLSYFRKDAGGIVSYDSNSIPLVAPLFNERMMREFGKARAKDEPLSEYHKDLAASVQRVAETVIFHVLNEVQKNSGLTNLCLAGGVAQNSVANGKIIDNTRFENIYIPPAAHDAGIAMGAALWVQHSEKNMPRRKITSAYTGSRWSNEEIKQVLTDRNISFKELADDELFDKINDTLITGGIAGWFNGRAEFGPRALGARSIIADPRRSDAKEIINSKIKRRESFRPFAPSILREEANEWFEMKGEVPFMEKVYSVKANKRAEIPAVTHVDGSGRLQTVDKISSPRWHGLINNFFAKTGVPILLNTSFNENEPIVNHPAEALDCFLRTDMDILVMENILIERQ